MSIVSIVGHPAANSFVSTDELNAFMNANDLSWVHISETEAQRLAIYTSSKIGNIRYLGQPLYPNQGLAFPRKNDVRVSARLYEFPALQPVQLPRDVEEIEFDPTPDGCRVQTDKFPVFSTLEPMTITVQRQGATVDLTDVGNGVLQGPGINGTIDYTTGEILLDKNLDNGTVARVDALWYRNDAVQSSTFQFDVKENTPDMLKTGSVHIPQPDGYRDYLDIISHNIVTGVLELGGRMSSTVLTNAIVFSPHARSLKQAVLTQLLAERGQLEWDKRANRGIRKVKIGDTEMSYEEGRVPSKARKLAGQYRVHESVFAMLAPFTIYGKMGMIFGEWNASAPEQQGV